VTEHYLLGVILFAPFVGAAVLATPWVSNRHPLLVRQLAAFFAGISFCASFYLLFAFDWQKGGYQFQQKYVWSEQLGIQFYIGVDGIGVPMVLASSILLFAGVFISWHIKDRAKEFYEMSVIPMYPLLGVWGSHTKGYLETTNADEWERPDAPRFILNFARNSKEYAAMKLTLFLSAGAVVALLGILLIYKASGLNTFEIPVLAEKAHFEGTLATIIWLLCFFGFASIAPLWPLHSWSPVGHAAAPAATSMLHAGVLMKLGHFSIIRTCFQILPDTTRDLMPIAAVLCIFSILYGGYVAYYARDTKYVIGYSSSSHMGYVFLGMAALDYISLSGAILYMFAHALATGMLFAMAGWVYDQTHTRDIPSLGGLVAKMPFVAGCFLVACMASIGMPGTVNFVAEVMIVLGSWAKYPVQTVIAVLGIVLTMAYLFRMMRGVFYGQLSELGHHAHDAETFVDRVPLLIMIFSSITFGLLPGRMLDVIRSGVNPILARIMEVAPVVSQTGSGPLP